MATSNLPVPQTVPAEGELIEIVSEGSSCCGGTSYGTAPAEKD